MKLNNIPNSLRLARTASLKYAGLKLKSHDISKNLRRRLILELDVKILMKIDEILNKEHHVV